jgi:predicted sulfurtransferase
MKGRILLSEEGINGSLSALDDEVMNKFIQCMEDYEYQIKLESEVQAEVQAEIQAKEEIKPKVENHNEAEAEVEVEVEAGAEIGEQTQQTVKEWRLVHPFENIDWKLSAANNDIHGQEEPFPDLKINIVKEIVSTGNAITRKDIVEHGGTHLTPKEFHQVLQESWGCDGHDNNNEKNTIKKKKELVVIDVRNTYEYAIGHFLNPNESSTNSQNTYDEKDCHEEKKPHRQHQQQQQSKQESNYLNSNNQNGNQNGAHLNLNAALNPEMIAFSTFDDTFCAKNESFLKDKKVLMYCTGGIRCEKASAMLKKRGVEDVSQLQGGIHRYLEEYPNGFFKGKNFVFDYVSSNCFLNE